MRYPGRTASDGRDGRIRSLSKVVPHDRRRLPRRDAVGTRSWCTGASPTQAKKDVSLPSQVFEYARDVGLTEYNPCELVERNNELPRDREALAWEVEALIAVAPTLLALMIRFVRITGWRGHEIRSLEHRQLEPGGILLQRAKGGKRELWEWTPELDSGAGSRNRTRDLPLTRRVGGRRLRAKTLILRGSAERRRTSLAPSGAPKR
ncbi:MAG: hypothetical protein ABW318_07410 [Vicinamibacterales bacterium]